MYIPFRAMALLAALTTTLLSTAAEHPGGDVYAKHCASCHENEELPLARSREALSQMNPTLIGQALLEGKMQAQAAHLTRTEVQAVVYFLAGQDYVAVDWESAAMCDAPRRGIDAGATPTISTFGYGHHNHRRLSAKEAGLRTADFPRLELAWALAFPNVTMMRSQPAIVGHTLYMTPVDSMALYAFDIEGPPCLEWVYRGTRPLRTSITHGTLPDGQAILVFGDSNAAIHAVDAKTGKGLWQTSLKQFPQSIVTGTPQIVGGSVYASLSQFEIMVGANPKHECCKASGGVARIDARSGEIRWFTPTLPEAKPVRDRGDGQMMWGPSGAPVWTSPAIDLKRGLLYVGTGEANSEPAHRHTDAILALDLEDGTVRWSFQATANDIFLVGCRRGGPNCPPEDSVNRDVDFGASVIIAQNSAGKDILLAGQKSSTVWALDPDAKGKVLWRWNRGVGSANGGIHWGIAFDGKRVFAPLSDPGRPRPGYERHPGLYAIDVDTGKLLWEHAKTPRCKDRWKSWRNCQFQYGFSAAPAVIDGAVVQGSLDGFLTVFDARTGKVLFEYDTIREYEGANGVTGRGGSIDSAAISAANGMLFVNSGYSMFGQAPGNVLLAFRPGSGEGPGEGPSR